jgi:leucyl aminopeptidase (aminopeptidase T)
LVTDDLSAPAAVCAERLGVKPGEKVAVLHNGPQKMMAEGIAEASRQRDADVRILEFEAASRSGIEPPEEVVELLRWADAGFGVTSASLSHTRARIDACAGGLRFASMSMLTPDIFLRAVAIDYPWMEAAGKELARLLTEADTCRLVSSEGTDAVLSIAGRTGRNDDGDLRLPGAFGNLPAGEGYVAPVENAGDGTLVFDGALTGWGRLEEPLAVRIEAGSIVEAHGPAAEYLLATLDAAEPAGSGRRVAELGIGTNPAARIIGIVLEDEKVLGTAHVAFGTSTGVGGVNQSTVHIDGIMRRPTLYIGDTCVLDAGRLLIDPGVTPAEGGTASDVTR